MKIKLSKLIYDKWYIDIAKLLDFCMIYGKNNKDGVK